MARSSCARTPIPETRVARLSTALAALVLGLVCLAPVTAVAGIVPTVTMGTAGDYSVLGATTVSNTNPSVIGQNVGLSPGSSIVGFPPGVVLAPATIDAASPATLQAQNDLTTAYVDAAGRPVEFTQTNPDLVGQTLIPGVYSATAKAPLGLSGQLVLDGQGNSDAVFIFQTDSTLITSSGSTIALINGASECNVFWQVGSSATLGSGSTFVGTILALTSVTVESNVVVHGRALARNGAVTLDNDVFQEPSCTPSVDTDPPATTVPTTTEPTTSGPATSGPATSDPATSGPGSTDGSGAGAGSTTPGGASSVPTVNVPGGGLPETGRTSTVTVSLAILALVFGAISILAARRRPV